MLTLFHSLESEKKTSVGINVVESTRIFPSLGRWLVSTNTSCWRRRRQESELFSEGVFTMLINTAAQNRSRIIPVPAIQLSLRIIFYTKRQEKRGVARPYSFFFIDFAQTNMQARISLQFRENFLIYITKIVHVHILQINLTNLLLNIYPLPFPIAFLPLISSKS